MDTRTTYETELAQLRLQLSAALLKQQQEPVAPAMVSPTQEIGEGSSEGAPEEEGEGEEEHLTVSAA